MEAASAAAAVHQVSPGAPVEAVPAAVLIEELWAQCDKCQKWRLLPPGSTPPSDNVPWFCTLNPDILRNRCDAAEAAWNENGTIEEPIVVLPVKKIAAPKKSGGLKTPGSRGATPGLYDKPYLKKRGIGAPDPHEVTYEFASLPEELNALNAACTRVTVGLGSWDAAGEGGAAAHGSEHSRVPAWGWAGLHIAAPAATRVAVYAEDVLSAAEYAEAVRVDGGGGGGGAGAGGGSAPHARAARLALLAAASMAGPNVEGALSAAAPAAGAGGAGA
ncbi:hypothetical protein FOA52_000583 [Chlamydomonas sp. UWO 241]|nr:hypothetical protein FOA52_000583 [Chlamydomonas sp. UWO 241]